MGSKRRRRIHIAFLWENQQGKRSIGGAGRRWEDDIKMVLREIE
jgi:hypothetical protein